MTNKELIEKLKNYDDEAEVIIRLNEDGADYVRKVTEGKVSGLDGDKQIIILDWADYERK